MGGAARVLVEGRGDRGVTLIYILQKIYMGHVGGYLVVLVSDDNRASRHPAISIGVYMYLIRCFFAYARCV